MTTIKQHIEFLVAQATADLLRQAAELEASARKLRAEAEALAAVKRQELLNQATGGKSLWRVTMDGYIQLSSMHGQNVALTGLVLATTAEEAKNADPASLQKEGGNWHPYYHYGWTISDRRATPV